MLKEIFVKKNAKKIIIGIILLYPAIVVLSVILGLLGSGISGAINASNNKAALFKSCPKTYDMTSVPKTAEEYDLYIKNQNLPVNRIHKDKYYIKDLKDDTLWFEGYWYLETAKRLGDDVTDKNTVSFLGAFQGDKVYYGKNGAILYFQTFDYKPYLGNYYCGYDNKGNLRELSYMNDKNYYVFNNKSKRLFQQKIR